MLLGLVRQDPVCRRLMTAPGVGPVVALAYRAAVDQPQRFLHSKAVGAHAGLTPKRVQSAPRAATTSGCSKTGDVAAPDDALRGGAVLLTHSRGKWSWLKAWGLRVAQRRGMRRAAVAVRRGRLAVILHRMWVDETDFRWTRDNQEAVRAA